MDCCISLYIFIIFVLLWLFKDYLAPITADFSHRTHAFLSNMLVVKYNIAVADYKKTLFSKIREDVIKNDGHIMEIGSGTGGSLDYYPQNITVKLTAVEPNSYTKKYLDRRLLKYPHIRLIKYVINKAEDMKDIPNNSIGCLVSTIVLCSVDDQEQVFREIRRVLKQGGKYYFMEHVADKDGTTLKWFQDILNAIWGKFFDGCNLNRDTAKMIKKASFKTVHVEEFNAKLDALFIVVRPHIMGYAEK